jgi:hypothetical protein
MEQFLALLFAYYTCDAAAQAQQPLGGDRLACVETYEEVKAFFAPLDPAPFGTPEYGAQRIETYVRPSARGRRRMPRSWRRSGPRQGRWRGSEGGEVFP